MTAAWRLVKGRHAGDAFSGEGARRHGGRWNHRGTTVVYASGSLALAALETFVHIGKAPHLRFVAFRIDIPDDVGIEVLTTGALPARWRQEPPPDDTKDIGTAWVARARSAVLRVPSVLVPGEPNYLLNPAHPDFGTLRIGRPEPFGFDPRMWK